MLAGLSVVIWAAFVLDYGTSVYLSAQRWLYIGQHLPELAMIVLPVLRPLRALRVMLALKALNKTATANLRGQAVVYIAGAVPLLVLVSALAILNAERSSSDANIAGFGDALWWACTTITTVGYGNRYPVTAEGRLIAVGLMIAGIAMLGVVTAALASWFVERLSAVEGGRGADRGGPSSSPYRAARLAGRASRLA